MAMTIQYGVRGMKLAAQSEAFKQENILVERLHGFRWMIYLVVLADDAESVRDAIRFEYCLASSSGWIKSPVLWDEIGESNLIGHELVQETTDKVVLIKEKLKGARNLSPWKGVIRFGKKGKLAPRFLTSLLDDGRGSGSWMFLFVWSGYAAMRTFCGQAKLLAVRYLVKVSWNSKCNFELTWVWEDYLKDKFDNQSIERDRLIGIGFVLDFVEFISFTFSDKEMILVIEAVSR
ncbi:hypothetical protein Tco_0583327 [Tanacetum coccineum]